MLPNDIARCDGVAFEEDGVMDWREGCEDCRRRTEKTKDSHWQMNPPPIIVFECEWRIEP